MFKKLFCAVLSTVMLTGCGAAKDIFFDTASRVAGAVESYNEENGNISPHKYAVNTFNEVFELVQAKDTQGIYNMFSEDAKNYADLMPEIERLVKFMDGEVTEIGHVGASNDYASVRDGETVSAAYSANSLVTTDSGILYWVKVGVITADEDETKLGLDWIYILDCNRQSEHTNEWVKWRETNFDDKKAEPQIPEDMSIGVHY